MNKPSNDIIMNSRAEQRRLKLLEAEIEQQQEELEALRFTEEQFNTLKQPFVNVKFEFFDLDGMYNPKHSFYTRQYRAAPTWNPPPTTATPAILTKADLARFSSDETIRLPSSRAKARYPSVLPTESLFNSAAASLSMGFASPVYRMRDAENKPMRHLDINLSVPLTDDYTALDHSPDIPYQDVFRDASADYNTPCPTPTPTKSFRVLPLH